MSHLRTNLDTYRVMAETLEALRVVVRTLLKSEHGQDWEEQALPQPMRGFLEQRRDREATIQWRLPENHDLLDFAGFENLAEIILANDSLERAFSVVSHDSDLLRARFLELDSIQNRIAFVRPVSEVELEFVVSVSERLRRVGSTPPKTEKRHGNAAPAPSTHLPEAEEEPSEAASDTAADDAPAETTALPLPDRADPTPAPAQPPRDGQPGAKEKAVTLPPVSTKDLEQALAEGQDQKILAALYAEVTRVAEALWSETSALSTPAWDRVRETPWYEKSFSKLGLKPVSDFYDLHGQASRRLADGGSRTDLQELLQERRFGEVLMALRELFRKHLVK